MGDCKNDNCCIVFINVYHNSLVNNNGVYSSYPQTIATGCIQYNFNHNAALEYTLWLVSELSPKHMKIHGLADCCLYNGTFHCIYLLGKYYPYKPH